MRDGRRSFPVTRTALGILDHDVTVVQAPPGMDAVGVVAAVAEQVDAGPVVLVPAATDETGASDTAELLRREIDRLSSGDPVVWLLTRPGPWSLADQTRAAHVLRGSPGHRAVLVTGTDRAFPVPPGIVLYSGRDLVLGRDDVAAFAAQRRLDSDAPTLERLRALTGGWPGLLQIAVDAMQEWPVPAAAGLDVAAPAVRHEVRRRLLPWLPPAWRSTAAHLAVAGTASAAEIGAAADAAPGDAVPVATFVRHGIASPEEDGGGLVLLAPLADALLDELAAAAPAGLAELRGRVSDLRARLGQGDCGLGIATTMQDWNRCARILADHLPALLAQVPAADLRATLAVLPESCFRAQPLLLRQAELFGVTPPGRGAATATAPTRPPQGARPTVPASRVVEEGAMLAATHARRGDLDLALRLVDDVDAVAFGVDAERDGGERVPLWHLNAGFTRLLAGDETGAARSLQAGWALRGHAPAAYAHALAFYLALRHAIRGEHAAAAHWRREAARHSPPADRSMLDVRGLAAVPELVRTVDALEAADTAATAGLDHHDQRWVLVAWAQSLAALTQRRVADALLLLEPPEGAGMRGHGLERTLLAPSRANAHLASGHGNRAAAELAPLPGDDHRARVVRARLHLLSGESDLALSETAVSVNDRTVPLRPALETGLLHAAALLATGEEAAATSVARDVVQRARTQGHPRALLTLPQQPAAALASRIDGLGALLEELYARHGGPLYPDRVLLVRLTERESAVLRGLQAGQRHEDLAATLHVSLNTVKSQLRSLYAKLGVHSREEAVRMARRHRLLD